MCAGALVQARVGRLVFGADDPKAGAVTSLFDLVRDPRLPHRVEVRRGVLDADSAELRLRFICSLLYGRNERKCGDGLLLPVLVYLEIFGLEIADDVPLFIRHGDVDLDEIRRDLHHFLVGARRRRRRGLAEGGSGEHDDNGE